MFVYLFQNMLENIIKPIYRMITTRFEASQCKGICNKRCNNLMANPIYDARNTFFNFIVNNLFQNQNSSVSKSL